MRSKEIISIIVPVYNVENYLNRCVNSILNQTYKNIEIILINDGSIDKSGDICDYYAQKDNRIKVIHQKNSGVSVARNTGLDIAVGEYITFVDSDDYIEPNYCEILLDVLNKNNADVAYCSDFSNQHIDINKEFIWKSKEYDPVYKTPNYVVWGALYRREVIQNIRFDNDLYVGEDAYFFAKVVKKSNIIVHIDNPLYHYIYYPNSAYNGEFNVKKFTELECWKRVCLLFNDNKIVEKKCKAALSIKSKNMFVRFINDPGFTERYKEEAFMLYRKNIMYLMVHMFNNHKYKLLLKEISHFLFPKLWIKHILNKDKCSK